MSFVHQEADPVTAARLLRLFDDARRDLARNVMRESGMGAGYDHLDVDSAAIAQIASGHVVTVTALVLSATPRRHLVGYGATASNDQGHCRVLVQAHGWTLSRTPAPGPRGVGEWIQHRSLREART